MKVFQFLGTAALLFAVTLFGGCKSTGGGGTTDPNKNPYQGVEGKGVDVEKKDEANLKRAANVSRGNPMVNVTRVWLHNRTRYSVKMNVAGANKTITGWIEPNSKKYVDVENHGGYVATWAYGYDGSTLAVEWPYKEWELNGYETYDINYRY